MTIFASKTPRDLNHDPLPYESVRWSGQRYTKSIRAMAEATGDQKFAPRPEFDHVQHNEPNPILVDFRAAHRLPYLAFAGAPWLARHWLLNWHNHEEDYAASESATGEQIDHARKVLTRLATLEESREQGGDA